MESQVVAGPSNPLTTPLATTSTAKRHRLTHKGTLFLQAYLAEHGVPNRGQKEALLPQVQAIEGCEDYTLNKLDLWFRRHKVPLPSQGTDNPKPSGRPAKYKTTPVTAPFYPDKRFPSLTQQTVEMLKVLLSGKPMPDQQTLNHWVDLLRCNAPAVTPWDVRAFAKSYQEDVFGKHLPTPEATVSPEPLSPALSPSSIRTGFIFKSDPLVSPILPKSDLAITNQDQTPTLSIHQPSHSQSTNEPSYLPSPVEPPRELKEPSTHPHSTPMATPSRPHILSVHEADSQGSKMIRKAIPNLRDPNQPDVPPRLSKEEFNKIWEKIDVALDFMLQALDDHRRYNQT